MFDIKEQMLANDDNLPKGMRLYEIDGYAVYATKEFRKHFDRLQKRVQKFVNSHPSMENYGDNQDYTENFCKEMGFSKPCYGEWCSGCDDLECEGVLMGRELRRVPPNWEHPKWTKDETNDTRLIGTDRPCIDDDFETNSKEWRTNALLWFSGKHPDQEDDIQFWEWEYPPERKFYRPAFKEEPTWYQLYETVSEGSPVSPPFATIEELATYLTENGDFWYQGDIAEGRDTFRTKPTYDQALNMCKDGHAFSVMISPDKRILQPHEQHGI